MTDKKTTPPGEHPVPVRKLERFSQHKYQTYEAADRARSGLTASEKWPVHKAKIFARYDGTFDLVLYKNVHEKEAIKKAFAATPEEIGTAAVKEAKKIHGLKSKDRKKST